MINYKFILLLNIDYLVSIYFLLSLFSLFLGMYYIFYKFKFKFDVNKTISLTGKFCLSFFIIIYSGIFIGLKTGTKHKAWLETVLFNYKNGARLYYKELSVITKGESKAVNVCQYA